jgi:hypothetical protein
MVRYPQTLLLAAILLLSKCTLAQDTPVTVVQPPPTANGPLAAGGISGKVMCADTHTPARGARIMVMAASAFGVGEEKETNPGPPQMAITALDGSFRVPHVPPGDYFILVFASGYLSPLDGVMVSNTKDSAQQRSVGALLQEKAPKVSIHGQETARVDVELQRGAILTGRVVYSDGSPAAQLPVQLQKPEPAKSESKQEELVDAGAMLGTSLFRQSPTTDDQGHFRISGIPGGRYRLAVTQKFEQSTNLAEDLMVQLNPGIKTIDRLTIYSGNTLHQKDAKIYELRSGETLDGVEIILPLTGLHSIQGVATGKDGTPLNFGLLSLSDTADPTISFHTNIRAGGEFRFSGIPEGIYEMKITRGGVLENPPQYDFPDEVFSAMQDQFKPVRAFAETKVAVTVQTTDIDDLAVTLADTKLPDKAAPAANSEKATDVVVVPPQ